MKKSGNTILITGGTSGIGLGLAERFHKEGNKVIVAGRRADLLKQIVAEHEGMEAITLDVADPASIRQCFDIATNKYPALNVVINNAGIMRPEKLTDPGHIDDAEATVVTNLLGPIRMLTAFVPFLIGQKDAVIVNVSSGLAFVPLTMTPTYCATKAAIHSYTESLRLQLAEKGVEVIELIPPAVQTDLMDHVNRSRAMPLKEFITEVMNILHTRPQATEICVDNVKFLRFAEATGKYSDALAMLNGASR